MTRAEIIIQLLGGGSVGVALTAFLTHWLTKRRFNAEVAREQNSLVRELLTMAREESTRRAEHLEACELKVEQLQKRIEELENKIG